MLKKLKRCEVIRVAGPRGDYAPLVDELKGLRDVLTNGATFDIDLALGWCEDNLIWCEQNGADELSEIVESENFDDFVARLELEPRMGRSIRRQFREYIYHNLIERCNGVWKDGGSPDDEGVVAWIREPENWLHRNNSHEVYAAMADHLGIKLTHENKRKMTKIIREALIADYEDNPDECYEWIVQLGLRLGAALKELAGRKAKKQRIEDPGSRQPGSLGLKIMEELLGGSMAPRAKVLCAGLEDAGRTMAVAKEVLGKPPEDDFGRALQRVARSTGSCEVVSKGTYGNTLFTLRKGAEDGMEELAHRSDFGKLPPNTPLWNFVSPLDQNGPMGFIDLVFGWLDMGVSADFVNSMVCKVHAEFQKAFNNWLDGSVKEPPKLAVLPTHLQALIDDEMAVVKRVNEFQRRVSGGVSSPASGQRGEEAQLELKKSKKKKRKKRGRDDADGAPAKAGKPASKGTAARGAGKDAGYVDALWDLSKKDGQTIKDKGMGACLGFLRTGECKFGAKCKFSHNKRFWDGHGVTWSAVKAAAGAKVPGSDSESEDGSGSRSRSRSRSQRRD
ncbi:hypothetical protein JL721_6753 [Aureococcus anophagefferens]|nr:hypothetical protein JL721_6753 [Aureococcus anophagefferens]